MCRESQIKTYGFLTQVCKSDGLKIRKCRVNACGSHKTLSIRKENIFETKLIPLEICQKYDKYGKLYSDEKSRYDCQTIKKGDLVEYIDSKTKVEGKKVTTIKIVLQGIWDGTQVKFDDKEETIVRTTHWLRLISTSNL